MKRIIGIVLSLAFIISSCGGSSSESNVYEDQEVTEDQEVAEGSTSDCDAFIKEYEELVDVYIQLAEKLKADPSDASIMVEYTKIMNQSMEMQENAPNCTDLEYTEKMAEIAMKMANAVSGM